MCLCECACVCVCVRVRVRVCVCARLCVLTHASCVISAWGVVEPGLTLVSSDGEVNGRSQCALRSFRRANDPFIYSTGRPNILRENRLPNQPHDENHNSEFKKRNSLYNWRYIQSFWSIFTFASIQSTPGLKSPW